MSGEMPGTTSSSHPPARTALAEAAWTALAGGLPFLVYLRTMAPTVYGLDSAELATGAYTLGIVHAPGSPTYMILGHLFSRLPFGDVGYRMNLMSAVAAALTLVFLYRVLLRLTGQRAVALGASWFAGFTYYFWISALAAELYAVHAAFVSGLLLLALRWREQGRPAQLCLLAFLFGIGTGNHLSMALLLPGFVWLVATSRVKPWQPAWLAAAAVVSGLAGAAVYLYLPLRYLSDTPLNYARNYWHIDLTTADGFRWMVTARMFEPLIFGVPSVELPHELRVYAGRLWSNFVGLGLLLGAAGLAGDLRRRPSLHLGLMVLFTTHLAFYLGYRVWDKELMLLPTYVVWAVWVGIGAQVFCRELERVILRPVSASALLFFLAGGTFLLNFGQVDLSDDWSARRRGERIFAALDPGAAFLGTWVDVPILEYLQIVERARPDVRTVNLLFTPGRAASIASAMLGEGRAVYTSAPAFLDGTGLVVEHVDRCGCFSVREAPAEHAARGALTVEGALP